MRKEVRRYGTSNIILKVKTEGGIEIEVGDIIKIGPLSSDATLEEVIGIGAQLYSSAFRLYFASGKGGMSEEVAHTTVQEKFLYHLFGRKALKKR